MTVMAPSRSCLRIPQIASSAAALLPINTYRVGIGPPPLRRHVSRFSSHAPRSTYFLLRLWQPKGSGSLLFRQRFNRHDIFEFKCARSTELDALGVAVTEITVVGNAFFR